MRTPNRPAASRRRRAAEYIARRPMSATAAGFSQHCPRCNAVRPIASRAHLPSHGAASEAAKFISEEMTLRELRKARRLTQVSIARELGVSQDAVSRMEQRTDLLLSTLRRTIEAMGGSLSLIARFPNRPHVEISGLAERKSHG